MRLALQNSQYVANTTRHIVGLHPGAAVKPLIIISLAAALGSSPTPYGHQYRFSNTLRIKYQRISLGEA